MSLSDKTKKSFLWTIFDDKVALEIKKIKLKHKSSLNPKLVLIGGQPGD